MRKDAPKLMLNSLLDLKRSNELSCDTFFIRIQEKNIQHRKIIYVKTICLFFFHSVFVALIYRDCYCRCICCSKAQAQLFDQTRNQRELRQLFVGWLNFGNKVVNWWRTWWKIVFYFIFIYFHFFLFFSLFKGRIDGRFPFVYIFSSDFLCFFWISSTQRIKRSVHILAQF